MPSLKEIRSRIDSVKSMQKTTRAMKMVSAAKLRRAQLNIINQRPYAQSMLSVISHLAVTQRISHPMFDPPRERGSLLLVVLASDRGLCGAFNSNVQKLAWREYQKLKPNYDKVDLFFVGRKVADYFKRRGVIPTEARTNLVKDISVGYASQIGQKIFQDFVGGQYDQVQFIYNEFKSAISQEVRLERVLPVDWRAMQMGTVFAKAAQDMILEPSAKAIANQFLLKHVTVQTYRCLSESLAAEHAARMTAMENATKNAVEMSRNLTLTYNKLRQASITKELIEITSGADAVS